MENFQLPANVTNSGFAGKSLLLLPFFSITSPADEISSLSFPSISSEEDLSDRSTLRWTTEATGTLKRKSHKAESGSVNTLPGECQAHNTENDPLLKLQHLKEDFDPNPNLHRAEGNPDWELN